MLDSRIRLSGVLGSLSMPLGFVYSGLSDQTLIQDASHTVAIQVEAAQQQ